MGPNETILDVQSNGSADHGTDELIHVRSRISRGTSFQFSVPLMIKQNILKTWNNKLE